MSRDIKKLSIIAETKDGQHLITITENNTLIDIVAEFCQFVIVKPEFIGQMNLSELIVNKLKEN